MSLYEAYKKNKPFWDLVTTLIVISMCTIDDTKQGNTRGYLNIVFVGFVKLSLETLKVIQDRWLSNSDTAKKKYEISHHAVIRFSTLIPQSNKTQ